MNLTFSPRSDLFDDEDKFEDLNSFDSSVMEKIKIIEALSEEERKTIYTMLDAFVGKHPLNPVFSIN